MAMTTFAKAMVEDAASKRALDFLHCRARVLSFFTEMMMASCSGAGYQGISEKLNTPWTTPTSASNAAGAFPSTSLQPAAALPSVLFFLVSVSRKTWDNYVQCIVLSFKKAVGKLGCIFNGVL